MKEEQDPLWWLDWILVGGMIICMGILLVWGIRIGAFGFVL